MSALSLPKPKIGDVTAITISSPDLETSLQFYKLLGFNEVMRFDFPFPWIQVSDGALLIMLRQDAKPYIALTYYVKEIDRVVSELEQAGIEFSQKPKDTDMIKRYLMLSPDGLNISLVSIVDGFVQPPGPTMLTMPQQDYFTPEKYVNKTCGLYGELAHPVTDLNRSILFWEKLGFKVLSKFESPYPWTILTDGLAVTGLHQTKNFSYPAITFFASDMKEKIDQLKNRGLKDYADSGPSNTVLTTPEKQHINLFKLGM
jgi:catechol 2,3-dioxygenase-like lactoylglutathione lyase family enzyme